MWENQVYLFRDQDKAVELEIVKEESKEYIITPLPFDVET